jgi:hypothetical protein
MMATGYSSQAIASGDIHAALLVEMPDYPNHLPYDWTTSNIGTKVGTYAYDKTKRYLVANECPGADDRYLDRIHDDTELEYPELCQIFMLIFRAKSRTFNKEEFAYAQYLHWKREFYDYFRNNKITWDTDVDLTDADVSLKRSTNYIEIVPGG